MGFHEAMLFVGGGAVGLFFGVLIVAVTVASQVMKIQDKVNELADAFEVLAEDDDDESDGDSTHDLASELSDAVYAVVKSVLHAKSCPPCGRECKSGECPGQMHFGFDEDHSE